MFSISDVYLQYIYCCWYYIFSLEYVIHKKNVRLYFLDQSCLLSSEAYLMFKSSCLWNFFYLPLFLIRIYVKLSILFYKN